MFGCPTCRQLYTTGSVCPKDGTPLVVVPEDQIRPTTPPAAPPAPAPATTEPPASSPTGPADPAPAYGAAPPPASPGYNIVDPNPSQAPATPGYNIVPQQQVYGGHQSQNAPFVPPPYAGGPAPVPLGPVDGLGTPPSRAMHGPPPSKPALAILGGVIATLIGAAIWAFIGQATHTNFSYVAIGMGALVGFAMTRLGRVSGLVWGGVAAVLTVIGCAVGGLGAVILLTAGTTGATVSEVLPFVSSADLFNRWSPLTLGISALGAFVAFRMVSSARPQ